MEETDDGGMNFGKTKSLTTSNYLDMLSRRTVHPAPYIIDHVIDIAPDLCLRPLSIRQQIISQIQISDSPSPHQPIKMADSEALLSDLCSIWYGLSQSYARLPRF
jgi:hypothetical protein